MSRWLLLPAILCLTTACATPAQQAEAKPKECRVMTPLGSRIPREVCGTVRDGTNMLENQIRGGGSGAISPAAN